MAMNLARDEALRVRGWSVFRSASRDHIIPQTGAGAHLLRIKIASALPVVGVMEGVAVPDAERERAAQEREKAVARARAAAEGIPLGVSRHIAYDLVTQVGNPDPVDFGEEEFVIATAPFDGFLTEMFLQLQGGGVVQSIAFRTTSGQTVFATRDFTPVVPGFGGAEPDFLPVPDLNFTPAPFQLQRLKVPVFAGEEVKAVVRLGALFPAGAQIGAGVIGFEGFILARQGSQAAVSQFGALTSAALTAAREAARQSSELAIERERTRRALEVERLRTERAQLLVKQASPGGRYTMNPFNEVLTVREGAAALERRAPTPPPAPRLLEAPPEPPSGEGKTFVRAWNPAGGSVGYLVPNPPPGGRVNVFDSRYTIWDASGRMVDSGAIIPVRSDQDIPAGARISRTLGGVRPRGLVPASGPGATVPEVEAEGG